MKVYNLIGKCLDACVYRYVYGLRFSWFRRSRNIPTHLTAREKIMLYRLAQSRSAGNVVEIGSYLGASSVALAAGIASNAGGGRVYCIDTWGNDAMTEGKKDTMQQFSVNTEALSSSISTIRGYSTQVVGEIMEQMEKIDMLFIDGDHSYEGCRDDWLAYKHLLAKNAIIACHDIGWAQGVQRVVDEEIRPNVVKETRLPNMWCGWLG